MNTNKANRKVLLINYDKRWGGGQEYLFTLINGLLKNDFCVGQLIAPNSLSEERFVAKFKNNKNYQQLVVERNSIILLWKIIAFARDYDIVHIHREHDIWLGLLIKLFAPKTKLVFSQHIKPTKKRKLLFLFDKTICNSYYVQSLFEEIYNKKTHLIFPSISIDELLPEAPLKLSGQPNLLMSAAYHKNQSEMLSIFKLALQELPLAKLYFIGPSQDQNLIDLLKAEIEREQLSEAVTILPSQDRKSYLAILKQADIVVSSYHEEAFGLAILEAVLLNKAIVLYGSGGPKEILQGYFKAVLIEKGEQKLFASKIKELYTSGQYALIGPQKELKEKFSEEQLINKHLKIYGSLLFN